MALSAARLKPILAATLEANIRSLLALGVVPYTELTKFCNATADAQSVEILNEIKTFGVISVSLPTQTLTVTGGSGGTVTIPAQTLNGTIL